MNYGDRGRQKVNFDYYIPAGTPVLDKNTGDVTYLSEAHIGKYPYPNNTEKTGGGYFSSSSAAVRYHKTSFESEKYHNRLHFPESMAKQNCRKTSAPLCKCNQSFLFHRL